MRQLRPQHDLLNYLDIVKDAKENDNYRLFALYDQGEIAAVTGFKPMITLYYGRFVWVCDLVTAEYKRSRGYGERLLSFVHRWASENEYEAVALSSGLHRSDAHRFYEDKMDYERVSFVFKKEI
ncbi:GNAT family N-acetyltransferase [Halobacillus sp. A1]|uniref:GNAT family N-acetyltransferase n=1 Tax=Halobacillus sp. A1 TaxID=2880262 RepID=UPI0020A64291|nr:GNAT family N-acetyltransferase [Halobacillus sp. A1]MCP3030112.1 GNAT family N-acetyltransferase [Halobacillus sp. A1]